MCTFSPISQDQHSQEFVAGYVLPFIFPLVFPHKMVKGLRHSILCVHFLAYLSRSALSEVRDRLCFAPFVFEGIMCVHPLAYLSRSALSGVRDRFAEFGFCCFFGCILCAHPRRVHKHARARTRARTRTRSTHTLAVREPGSEWQARNPIKFIRQKMLTRPACPL